MIIQISTTGGFKMPFSDYATKALDKVQEFSCFQRLPTELRVQIWELAITAKGSQTLSIDSEGGVRPDGSWSDIFISSPRTSKVLRNISLSCKDAYFGIQPIVRRQFVELDLWSKTHRHPTRSSLSHTSAFKFLPERDAVLLNFAHHSKIEGFARDFPEQSKRIDTLALAVTWHDLYRRGGRIIQALRAFGGLNNVYLFWYSAKDAYANHFLSGPPRGQDNMKRRYLICRLSSHIEAIVDASNRRCPEWRMPEIRFIAGEEDIDGSVNWVYPPYM
jgi:hypothetical protein